MEDMYQELDLILGHLLVLLLSLEKDVVSMGEIHLDVTEKVNPCLMIIYLLIILLFSDDVFGRCCGGGKKGMGCGGYVGGKPALEHYKEGEKRFSKLCFLLNNRQGSLAIHH